MKGLILEKKEGLCTFLGELLVVFDGCQNKYNWLITDYECYPQKPEIEQFFSQKYCWLSGKELTTMIEQEDFQWIWGVLSGFEKRIKKESILSYEFPEANNYTGFWENPISLQHPLADIEIVFWDNSLTLLVGKDDKMMDLLAGSFPMARDLEEYNN